MTIDELITATGLTANDEIPIWDAEATGEPTKKITAQQLATAIVALASLVTSINGETGVVTLTAEDVNAKATQTSVANPTASGNALSFIDSITQDEQGVITPTKKSVPYASTTTPGLMSAQDKADLDALDGTVGDLSDDVDGLTEAMADKASAIVDTASGAIASFPDGAAVAAKDITIGIEPVQSGSGDPSPTNVRPISGWTGAKVANISDSEKQPYFAGLLNGTYGFVDFGTLNWVYRTNVETPYFYTTMSGYKFINNNPNCLCSQYATVSVGSTGSADGFFITDTNQLRVRDTAYSDAATFKAAMSGVYLIYELATPTTSTITKEQFELLLDKFGISGGLIPISWQSEAGTVYGGTLDVTTGLLTVTMAEVDLGTLDYVKYEVTEGTLFRTIVPLIKEDPDNTKIVCSNYATVWLNLRQNNTISKGVRAYVDIIDNSYSDAAIFKAAMSGVQLVYELATPQTYQLTPTQIALLLGDNNVWADTGDSTVTYRADTKLYIQKINAPTDDDMIADAQIASGKYFIIGGNLYKSTTTIPAGDTITPGTNCILTNLADALNALNT